MLYEKTADGWSGTAYEPSVTKEDAMIDRAEEFGLSDPFAGEWQIDLDEDDILDFVLPRVGFGKGFFVTDPLYAVTNQIDDPESLAEGAEVSGLAAGSSAVNTGSTGPGGTGIDGQLPANCSCDLCIQNFLAYIADALISNPEKTTEEILEGYEFSPAINCLINFIVTKSSPPSAWGQWACGAWGSVTPDSAGWCNYSTTSSRQRTRTVSVVCWSFTGGITTVTTTQFMNQSGNRSVAIPANPDGTCTPPAGCGPPNPGNTITTTGWSPPHPGCP